jgi:hypothetical protein
VELGREVVRVLAGRLLQPRDEQVAVLARVERQDGSGGLVEQRGHGDSFG